MYFVKLQKPFLFAYGKLQNTNGILKCFKLFAAVVGFILFVFSINCAGIFSPIRCQHPADVGEYYGGF